MKQNLSVKKLNKILSKSRNPSALLSRVVNHPTITALSRKVVNHPQGKKAKVA